MKKKKTLAKQLRPDSVNSYSIARSRQHYLLRDLLIQCVSAKPETPYIQYLTGEPRLPRSLQLPVPPHPFKKTYRRSVLQCLITSSTVIKILIRCRGVARFISLVSISYCLLLSVGCAVTSNQISGKVDYANPPTAGSWLQSQRELMACETIVAARYMADFGFVHPLCKQLDNIGPKDYLVKSREIIQLREGPMWLVRVLHQKKIFFMPIPWHDWL